MNLASFILGSGFAESLKAVLASVQLMKTASAQSIPAPRGKRGHKMRSPNYRKHHRSKAHKRRIRARRRASR